MKCICGFVFQAPGLDLKDASAAAWPYPSVHYHPYDAAFAGYHFNG